MAALISEIIRSAVKPNQRLDDYRCSCGRLLIRARLQPGTEVEVFCDRCRRRLLIVATDVLKSG